MDESALSTVQRPQKILATKARKQIGAITSAERGSHSTVVCCMNAIGHYIPPTLIFARKKWKPELIDGAPAGTLGLCQESGWMTGELFCTWLKHFVKYFHSSQNNKTLLLLDGHVSHKKLSALLYAKEHGVIILCIPPHCTQRLQPLDVSFFGPLSTYYNQAISKWLKNNPGRTVSPYQIGMLFTEAYGQCANMENSVSGFKNTGIHPYNPTIFPDWMFSPSDVTDIPEQEQQKEPREEPKQKTPPPLEENNSISEANVEPNSSHDFESSRTSIENIMPIPKASTSYRRQNRKRKGDTVLTSTPNLEELKMKEEEKRQILERKAKRQRVTKNLMPEETEDDTLEETFFDEDDDDAACIYCNGLYSRTKPGDLWLRCQICKKWTHAECADVSSRTKSFICELCC